MIETFRPVAEVTYRGLGLAGRQVTDAKLAAEFLAKATGISTEEADQAIAEAIEARSPKPQRFSSRLPQKW